MGRKNGGYKMNLSTLLAFGTTEIVLVSVFGAIFLGIVIYYCFVPMKNLLTALFSGAYIPSFKLISIKNRKLVVSEVVGAYVMAKKSKLKVNINQIESVMLSGGNIKEVLGALNLAKHDVMEAVSSSIYTKVFRVENVRAFALDKIEIVADVAVSVKLNLEKYTSGLGIDELKATISAWLIENISKTENHSDILREPNKSLLGNLDLNVVAQRSMFTVLDVSVARVQTGRDLNAELEIQAAEKEKIYAGIEAERMKHAEEIRELKMRTKTEEMKSQVLESEKEIPLAISQAIKEGRFSVMDYYKLMNLQADTALRRAFIKDGKNVDDDDEGEF